MADGSVKIDIVADDSDIKKKLKNVEDEAEEAADKLDDLGDSAKDSGKGFNIADVAIGNFISNGVTQLVGKVGEAVASLIALADETREYREDMAKLTAAFKTAGHTTETAQKAYDGFYKILGESDRSVEAVNHLAELTKNTEEVAKWSDIAAGVTAKFGDSLPIEGLTEAANETAKVGAVTGPLADALNWAGISEDAFNEKLKACNSEQERATLITNTLSTEYQAAAAEYNELTASTQAARDATNRMEQAQAELGAAIEPLTTWWTNAKASMMSWASEGVSNAVNGLMSLKTNTDILTESQRKLVNETNARAQAYKDVKTASAELAAAQMADVEYATTSLIPQLQALVDANGNVKKGYEERANFIMTQLNEAFGTEYTRISEIIGANGQLTESIQQTIAAKQAEILLAKYQADFKEATENIVAETAAREDLNNQISAQIPIVQAAEKEKQRVYAETAKAFNSGVESQVRQAQIKRSKVDAVFNSEKNQLEELNTAYDKSGKLIDNYNESINIVTEATGLMMKGQVTETVSYLQNLGVAYEETGSKAQKTADEQKAAVEEQLKTAAITYGRLKATYEAGEESMTEAQKTEMNARIKAAEEEVEKLGTEAEKLGSNLVEGIGVGADGKKDWLSGKLGGIVSEAVEYAKKIGLIHSPSRKTRDEVGIPLAQGIAVGIEKASDEPIKAMHGVFDSLDKSIKEYQSSQKKTIKSFNDDIAELNKQLVEDKKKENADIEALEKQHADKVASIRESIKSTIAGKMQEVVDLEKSYKDNVQAIWTELDKSINDVLKNYDDQLASRTESIANSLNLWNEATKNTVTGKELTKNLESQISVLESYNNSIAVLEGKNLSEAFINQLKSLGVNAAGEIEALAKMTDDELNAYVALWEEKNALAKTAAIEELEPLKAETEAKITELTNAALDKYTELRTEYQTQGALLMTELKQAMIDAGEGGYEEIISQIDDYMSAGNDLMEGIVAGIVSGSPALVEAVTNAVNNAIAAAEEMAEGESKSKVISKYANFSLSDAMNGGLLTRMNSAVDAENAKMAQGVGVADTGVMEVARAVGMQTAGINSLASVFSNGSNAYVEVPIIIDGREFGRAVVNYGASENARTGKNELAFT